MAESLLPVGEHQRHGWPIVFLASEASRYVHGLIHIAVDWWLACTLTAFIWDGVLLNKKMFI